MVFILIAAILLCGCSTLQPSNAPDVFPELIQQEPLPPWPFPSVDQEVVLDVKIRVGSDGSVKDVLFLTPGLSRDWSALAFETMRLWKFSPALIDGRPVAIWIRQTFRLRFEPAAYLRLAEIVCPNQQVADSVYSLLDGGAPFDSLATAVSISSSRTHGGFLGDVDLRTLPLLIRYKIQKLSPNHHSSPLALGRNFVIYKCLPAGVRIYSPN